MRDAPAGSEAKLDGVAETLDAALCAIARDRPGIARGLARSVDAAWAESLGALAVLSVARRVTARNLPDHGIAELNEAAAALGAHFDGGAAPGLSAAHAQAVALLGFGAVLVPATRVRSLALSGVLRAAARESRLGAMGKIALEVAEFADRGHILDATLVGRLRHPFDAERQRKAAIEACARFLADEAQRTVIYQPATIVWQRWLDTTGALGAALRSAIDGGSVDAVRSCVTAWSDEAHVDEQIDRTDRAARGRLATRTPIEARARTALRGRAVDAVRTLEDWLGAHSAGITRSGDAATRAAQRLAEAAKELGAAVDAELDELLRDTGPFTADAAAYARAAWRDLRAALHEGGLRDPRPMSYDELRSADLLAVPSIRGDRIGDLPREFATSHRDALLEAARATEQDWRAALAARCDTGDMATAARLLSWVRDTTPPGCDVEAFAQLHDDAQARHERDRIGRLAELRTLLATCYALNLLTADERQEAAARLEDLAASGRLDLHRIREELDAIPDDIERRRRTAVAEIRGSLATQERVDPHAAARIHAVLDRGQIQVAREWLDLLEHGEALPASSRDSGFDGFWPELVELVTGQAGRTAARAMAELAERLAGGDVGPLRWDADTPEDQRRLRLQLLDAWQKLRDAVDLGKAQVVAVLERLGFVPTSLDSLPGPGKDVRWFRLRTRTVADREICPIPAYGSSAEGRYRLLLLRNRRTAESIVEHLRDAPPAAEPVIVLLTNVMTVAERCALRAACRSR